MIKYENSIVVLITFFGNKPWYFEYFVHSCKYNPSIDFIIFTDLRIETSLSKNIKIISNDLKQLQKICSNKLRFKVSMNYPYKLCDYKPAYGLIFENYIKRYDFWAQSDLDNIFGNLRAFFSDDLLNNVDFVSARHDYSTGCFTLFRNNKLMNNLFKSSKDYIKVFASEEYLGFDELNFKHCEISDKNKLLEETETEIECFTQVIKKVEKKGLIRTQFDFILLEGVPGRIKYEKGKLTYQNKFEAALYHLYWLKKVYTPTKRIKKINDVFYVSPTRIYTRNL